MSNQNIDDLKHLTGKEIAAIHDSILKNYSGLKGKRPDLSVDALVGRIQSNLTYQSFNAVEEIAALYAEVVAKGHVFNDGNKRTALLSMITFLDINGYQLVLNQDDLADQIVDLADGKSDYKRFAMWLRPKLHRNN